MFNQPYPNYPYFNLIQMQIPKIQIKKFLLHFFDSLPFYNNKFDYIFLMNNVEDIMLMIIYINFKFGKIR